MVFLGDVVVRQPVPVFFFWVMGAEGQTCYVTSRASVFRAEGRGVGVEAGW